MRSTFCINSSISSKLPLKENPFAIVTWQIRNSLFCLSVKSHKIDDCIVTCTFAFQYLVDTHGWNSETADATHNIRREKQISMVLNRT